MDQADICRYIGEMFLQSKAEIQQLRIIIEEKQKEIVMLQSLLSQYEQTQSSPI